MSRLGTRGAPGPAQRGLALTETSAALALAASLLAAVYAGAQHAKRVYFEASALAQLQDRERTAMTAIADAVESSGDATGPALTAAPGSAAAVDSLTTRVPAAVGDALAACTAGSKGGATARESTVAFSIDASLGLLCSRDGAPPVPLVAGVEGMSLLFGVKTDTTAADGSFDRYLTAPQMAAADWRHVVVVNVTLRFRNPLTGRAGQPATIPFQRTIAVMAHAGVRS